jgi:hypothetical protein
MANVNDRVSQALADIDAAAVTAPRQETGQTATRQLALQVTPPFDGGTMMDDLAREVLSAVPKPKTVELPKQESFKNVIGDIQPMASSDVVKLMEHQNSHNGEQPGCVFCESEREANKENKQ